MIGTALRFSAAVIDGGVAVVSAVGGATADGLRWIADYGGDDSSVEVDVEIPVPDRTQTED